MSGSAPDVLVVGGGAVGVACAYEIASAGGSVTLLERHPEVGLGCSYGNAGLVGASLALPLATPEAIREGVRWMFDRAGPLHLPPRPALLPWLLTFARASTPRRFRQAMAALTPMSRQSWQLHLTYSDEGVVTGLERRGAVLTWETPRGFESGVSVLRQGQASAVTTFSREQACQEWPMIGHGVVGAAFLENIAHVDSREWTMDVARAAAELGACIKTGESVVRIVRDGRRATAVETKSGKLTAGAVVVAAGVWTRDLLRPYGVRLLMEAGKGYHVDMAAEPSDAPLPIFMQESHVVATPLKRCLRLAGTLELTGLETSIDKRRIGAIIGSANRNLKHVGNRTIKEVWAGLRPCAADGMPIIGRLAHFENVLIATGHAMLGLFLAPATGRLISRLLASEPLDFNIDAFRPERF